MLLSVWTGLHFMGSVCIFIGSGIVLWISMVWDEPCHLHIFGKAFSGWII